MLCHARQVPAPWLPDKRVPETHTPVGDEPPLPRQSRHKSVHPVFVQASFSSDYTDFADQIRRRRTKTNKKKQKHHGIAIWSESSGGKKQLPVSSSITFQLGALSSPSALLF
jgi:hypothetical protein